ncbi:23S rRNA pseudouridine2605 synthase [Spirosoma oryzae]|uniref:Pseudouridine synthase n=1 Tax=Spirosoma oryzae TaxID=1469603 RepID=A0A2T0T5H2_9BACT|nr:pseudouridine synthase [Spirosoma oryzae]PRY40874.1 23S rRNA pseudouridine2605 synthase [Spirosoma oryzae]
MNQDSDSNDRFDGPKFDGPRRDGQRPTRSTDRRDDDNRPRFNRDSNARDNSTDRPRFNRDSDSRSGDSRSGSSRFGRDNRNNDSRSDRRSDDTRPRFNRDNERPRSGDSRNGDSRPERRSDDSRPRFNRDNDRTNERPRSGDSRFNRRDDGQAGDRPRFNRDSNSRSSDSRSGNPRFNRDDRNSDRFQRDGFRKDSDSRTGDSRFNRNDNDRPRFNRDTNERSGSSDRPRSFSRDDRNNDRPQRSGDSRSGDSRSGDSRFNRDEAKPRFSRGNDRSNDRRGGRNQDSDERFTSKQRKESGERRTGQYDKAPDYERETARLTRPYDKRDPRNSRMKASDKTESSEPKQPSEPGVMRLNRYIANAGVCSRREADELIERGDISVNGKVVVEMGYKVKPGDTVKHGTKVLNPEKFIYVLLNKPKDFITTTEDPEERRTVMELVADAGPFRIYPVGRLDRNTTGLLLLTNDGELADKLTHPSNNIRKIYQVELDKPITEEHFETLRKGITLEDGPIKPDALSIVTPDAYVVGIEIHSGRNRIVRRMFEHLGYEVTKLDRTTYAGLTKKELPRGKWRFLEPKEVVKLKYFN